MINAKKVEHSAKVGIEEWDIVTDAVRDALNEAVSEAVEDILEQRPPSLEIPITYHPQDGIGGPPPEDPLTVRIELELAEDEDENCSWDISLTDVLEEYLEDTREDGSWSVGLLKFADGLEALAKKIREACADGEKAARK